MAFIKNRFDKDAQENGKFFDYDGGKFKIASMSNTAFIKAYGEYQAGDASQEDFAKVIAETILLDWDEIYDEDGETTIPYSVEAATEFLVLDTELLAFIINTMNNRDNYRRELVKKKTKK